MTNASFSVVITAVSTPELAAPALAKTCAIEVDVAATILRKAPITLLRELTEEDVAFVKPHLVRISSSGLDFKITPKSVADLPKVNWPTPPDLRAMFTGGVDMAPPSPAPGPPPRKGHTSRIPAPTPDVVVLDVHCPCCQAGLKVRKVEGQVQVQEVTPPKVNPLPVTPVHQRTVEELAGYGNAPTASPVVRREEAQVSYTNSPLLDSAPAPAVPPPSLDRPAAAPRRQEVGAPVASPPGFSQSPSPPPAAPMTSPAAAPGFQVNRPKREAAPDTYSAHIADQESRASAQPQQQYQNQQEQMVESRDTSGDERPQYARRSASLDADSHVAPPLGFAVNRPRAAAPFAPPPSAPPAPPEDTVSSESDDYELPPVTSPFVILEQPPQAASFPTPEQREQADGLDLEGLGLDTQDPGYTASEAALNAALRSQGTYEPAAEPDAHAHGGNGASAEQYDDSAAHQPDYAQPAHAREVGRLHESGLMPEPDHVGVAGDFMEHSEAPALRIVSEELHLYRSETGIAAARGNGPDGFQHDAQVATSDSDAAWNAHAQIAADPDIEEAQADLEAAEAAMRELEVAQGGAAVSAPAPFPGAQRGPTRPPPPPQSAPLTPAQRTSLSIDAVGELDELNTLPEDDARITKVMMSLNPNLVPPTLDNAEQAAAAAHNTSPMFDPMRNPDQAPAYANRGAPRRIDEMIHSADHSGSGGAAPQPMPEPEDEEDELEPWTGRARDYRDPDAGPVRSVAAPQVSYGYGDAQGSDPADDEFAEDSSEYAEDAAADDADSHADAEEDAGYAEDAVAFAEDGAAAEDADAYDDEWDAAEQSADGPVESDLGEIELMESAAHVEFGGPMLSEPEIAAGVEEVGVEPASMPAMSPMSLESATAALQAREAMAHMQDELDGNEYYGDDDERPAPASAAPVAPADSAMADGMADGEAGDDDDWGEADGNQIWGSAELGVVAEDTMGASEADDDGDLEPWTGRARDYAESDAHAAQAGAAAEEEEENLEPWTGRAREYVDPDGPPNVGEALVQEGSAVHDLEQESLEPWAGRARSYVDPDAPADVEALVPGGAIEQEDEESLEPWTGRARDYADPNLQGSTKSATPVSSEAEVAQDDDDGLEPWTGRARDYVDPNVQPTAKPKPQGQPAAPIAKPAAAAAPKPAAAAPKPAAASSRPAAAQLASKPTQPKPAQPKPAQPKPAQPEPELEALDELGFEDDLEPVPAASSKTSNRADFKLDADDLGDLDFADEPGPKGAAPTGPIASPAELDDIDDIPELDAIDDLPEPAPAPAAKGKDKKKTGQFAKDDRKTGKLIKKKTGQITAADASARAAAAPAAGRPAPTGRVPAKGSTRGPAAGRATGRVAGPPSGRGPRPTRRLPPKKKGPVGPDGLPLDDDIDLSDELRRAGAGSSGDDDIDAILGKIDLDAADDGGELDLTLDDELTLESRQQLKPTNIKVPKVEEKIAMPDAEPELDFSADDGEPDLDLSLDDEAPKPGASARRGRAGGGGASGWTLFLSKPNSAGKVTEAIQLLAELKGCSEDEAKQLVSRMVIPVLKDVPQAKAEDGLAKLKKAGLSGRMTQKK